MRLIAIGLLAVTLVGRADERKATADEDTFVVTSLERQHLIELEIQCTSRVLSLGSEIESVNRWSNIFLVVGATLAAVGSACAGTLSAKRSRKVAAVVGAFGAIVTVLPKTLKEKDHITQTMVHADAHRNSGEKAFNQLDYVRTNGLRRRTVEYVSARFTECEAVVPTETVPDLPSFPTEASFAGKSSGAEDERFSHAISNGHIDPRAAFETLGNIISH